MHSIKEVLGILENNNIEYQYNGEDIQFKSFCPLNYLKENAITWARTVDNIPMEEIQNVDGIVLLVELDCVLDELNIPVLYVENVHRTFFKIVAELFKESDPENRECNIASTAVIETDKVGRNVYVGHHSFVGKDVVIGENVQILNNVTIQGNVSIGDYSVIESGTTIGACGFGHYTDLDGNPVCVPHFGGVRIGKHVKIGANNAISRGCLADTIIEDYVKTDNLCHIAHNDHIKRGAMLTAGVVISGSTTVEENVWLAPGSVLNNSITVGKDSFLGLGTVATKDIPEGKLVVGVPAKVLKDRTKEK